MTFQIKRKEQVIANKGKILGLQEIVPENNLLF